MTLIDQIYEHIFPLFENDSTGHDIHHIERVLNMARYLQSKEGGDIEIIELAALLHDVSDHKFNGGQLNIGGDTAKRILLSFGYPENKAEQVKAIIDNVSYKGAGVETNTQTIEAKIVQDADRLDAIGAIGIARTFAYGGKRGQAIYDPELYPKLHSSFEEYANAKSTTINHFYEKLLLLNERLNTDTAKKIGKERHRIMEVYLRDFFNEWNFNLEQ